MKNAYDLIMNIEGAKKLILLALFIFCFINAWGVCAHGSVILDYRMDECSWDGTSGEVIDSSGNGLHGTTVNGPRTSQAQLCFGGVFDSSRSQYIEVPYSQLLNPGNSEWSISFWIYYTGGSNAAIIYDSPYYKARIVNGYFEYAWSPRLSWTRTPIRILRHRWYHIVQTYDKVRQRVFVDRRLRFWRWQRGIMGTFLSRRPMVIGAGYGALAPFDGTIDEFKVFNQALSMRTIRRIFFNERRGRNWDGSRRTCAACSLTPLADYHMDECSWDGTSGEVIDSSGNGYNATAQGALISDITDILCNHGQFYANQYLILPNPVPVSRVWTLSLWVKFPLDHTGHIALWLGWPYRRCWVYVVGTVSGTGDLAFIAESQSTGNLYWGVYDNRGRFRPLKPFPSLSGWHHLAFVASGSRTSLYIDGTLHNSVNLVTSGDVTILMSSTDLTNQETMGSDVDEVLLFDAALSQAQIQAIYNNQRSGYNWDGSVRACPRCGVSIDHYEIHQPGSALTCTPAQGIELRACEDANCTTLFTGTPSTVTLAPTGWIGGDTKTFVGSATNLELYHAQAGVVTIGISNSNPPADYCCVDTSTGATTCTPGDYSSCQILFEDSGFIFNQVNATSCTDGHALLMARRTSSPGDPSARCIPAFANTDKRLTFWANYNSPPSGTNNLSVNGTTVGPPPGLASNVTLHFDANGDAPFSVHYPDAGRLWLGVNGTGNYTNMKGGNYALFVPAKFAIQTPLTNAGLTGTPKERAGRPFPVAIQAQCGNGTLTGNYEANATLWIDMAVPVGASAGTLNFKGRGYPVGAGASPVTFVNGTAEDANASFTDIGVIEIHVSDGDYFNHSIPTTNATIGRFYPDHFSLVTSAITEGCTSFTYMGQPFSISFDLVAESHGNTTTQNYDTALLGSNLTAQVGIYAEDVTTGTPYTQRVSPGVSGNWTSGGFLFAGNFTFQRGPLPDGPFSINLGINATDPDDVPIRGADLKCSGAICEAKLFPDSPVDFLYGHLDILNNYGPETDNLTMETEALFWDGTKWALSVNDSCTALAAEDFALSSWQDQLDPGETSVIASAVHGISGGTGDFKLSAPGTGNWGSVTIDLNATSRFYPWLSGGLNGTATFGLYRGNDRLIHWMELE